jgi:hypothetical protein
MSPSANCDYKTQWQAPAGNIALDDLAIAGPGQGWAVGALTGDFGSGSNFAGVIYQLSQGQWTRLPQTYPGAEISTISMDSPTDGWAASTSAMAGQGSRALVLHYTGGQWRQEDIPALDAVLKGPPGTDGGSIQWLNIEMFGPDAGWMFALTNIPRDLNNPASREEIVILRYEQGIWRPVAAPNVDSTTELFWLSAVSPNEAWISATDYAINQPLTTFFPHYINGAWHISPQTFSGVTERMSMVSPTDGWAFDDGNGGDPGLLHYDGSVWRPVAPPRGWTSDNWTVAQPVIYSSATANTNASGATWFDVFVRPQRANILAQYSHGQWSQVAWPYSDPLPARIIADSAGDLWGIGDIGHQHGCPPLLTAFTPQGVFYHQHQGTWSEQVLV